MAETRTKSELLNALRANEQYVTEKLSSLPASDFEAGRYESGWNGRQILAHTATIEWTYPKLIDIAKEGSAPTGDQRPGVRGTEPGEAKNVPTRATQGGIGSYNERQVAKRESSSVEELLTEFKTNRAATIAAVEAADEELFGREIRSAGGITGVLADVVYAVAVLHVKGHVDDIIGAN